LIKLNIKDSLHLKSKNKIEREIKMDMQLINKIIEIIGNDSAIKLACGISRSGSINMELDKSKIERAQFFELLKPNKLELTDMGKIFVVKLIFDYADNLINGEDDDEEDEDEEEWENDDNWSDIEEKEEWDDEEDWDEEDEDTDDWEELENEDGDEEDDDEKKNYKPRGDKKI